MLRKWTPGTFGCHVLCYRIFPTVSKFPTHVTSKIEVYEIDEEFQIHELNQLNRLLSSGRYCFAEVLVPKMRFVRSIIQLGRKCSDPNINPKVPKIALNSQTTNLFTLSSVSAGLFLELLRLHPLARPRRNKPKVQSHSGCRGMEVCRTSLATISCPRTG